MRVRPFRLFGVLALAAAIVLGGALPWQPCGMALSPVMAAAPVTYEQTPLVVIRFNQQNVYYQRPLYTAIAKAVEAKPGVQFQVVSYAAAVAGETPQQSAQQAMTAAAKVVQTMKDIGVPASRIHVANRTNQTIANHEVHVFVR